MPTDEFVKQRTTNQEDVLDTLRQVNSFMQLPSLKEYDDFIENLWNTCSYRMYIINYLMRNFYTRNVDLIFDIDTGGSQSGERGRRFLYEASVTQVQRLVWDLVYIYKFIDIQKRQTGAALTRT